MISRSHWTPLVLSLVVAPLVAFAEPLGEVVSAMAKQATLEAPLRAELEMNIDGLDGKRSDRAILLQRPSPSRKGADTFLAIPDAGLRYLILTDGRAWVADHGKTSKAGLDTSIAGSSWTVEDILPFAEDRCEIHRAVSTLRGRLSFLCETRTPGQYILTVYKVHQKTKVARRVMRYQERQDNLVKMIRNEQFENLGGRWRPARMEMENFRLRTRDVFTAKWSRPETVPAAVFDPNAFATVEVPSAG